MSEIITAAQYREMLRKKKSGPRIKNARRTIASDGTEFDSWLECACYEDFLLDLRGGWYASLDLQVRTLVEGPEFKLASKVDFTIVANEPACRKWKYTLGELVWREAKGMEGDRFKMYVSGWRKWGPGRLEIWKGKYERGRCIPYLASTIWPKGMKQ